MPVFNDIRNVLAAAPVIGKEQISEAEETRKKYKDSKAEDDKNIKEQLDWFRLRQRNHIKSTTTSEIETSSAWLLNIIANKHADAMDNMPRANILPRCEDDEQEAKNLSDIIPAILEQDNFENTYNDASWYLYISGTTAYGTFWDKEKHNGLGDISIKCIDVRNLFWEPGVDDIQESRNVFYIQMYDNDELEFDYPQLKGKLTSGSAVHVAQYEDDSSVDTSHKSVVVDWYYKRKNSRGKKILHLCKYCNGELLYSSENDPETADRGYYDDGMYPFDIGRVYLLPGKLGGFGMVAVCKNGQEYIDRLSQAILENSLANTAPRYFSRDEGNINEQEMLDYRKPIVHVGGSMQDISIKPIEGKPLPAGVLNVLQQKIDEVKETSGTRDVATGGTTSGVTAASAIAAMQEAGSKLSRDIIASQYRTFKNITVKVIERIRQFYTLPRYFRILGERGAMAFIQYSNKNIAVKAPYVMNGVEMQDHIPEFDVQIVPEKKSPYKRVSQNELALQLYQMGFFEPQRSSQALACVDMMDFDRKDKVVEKIAQNGTLFEQLQAMTAMALQYAQMLDEASGGKTGFAPQLEAQIQQMQGGAPVATGGGASLSASAEGKESANTRAARQRVAESTSPS